MNRILNDDEPRANGFRHGHGEPADLYESLEFASDLEAWTEQQAQALIDSARQRRLATASLPEIDI